MPTEIKDKCEICRYSCKTKTPALDCKFYPKNIFLGNPLHFEEDLTRHYGKHEETSRICCVCKEYFNYKNISWIKGKKGLYPFCLEDVGP